MMNFNAVIENRIFRNSHFKFIVNTENYNKPNNPHFCHKCSKFKLNPLKCNTKIHCMV